jgi:hypothetical protein
LEWVADITPESPAEFIGMRKKGTASPERPACMGAQPSAPSNAERPLPEFAGRPTHGAVGSRAFDNPAEFDIRPHIVPLTAEYL